MLARARGALRGAPARDPGGRRPLRRRSRPTSSSARTTRSRPGTGSRICCTATAGRARRSRTSRACSARHRVAAVYTLTDIQALTIGKVVIRGNFRTATRSSATSCGSTRASPLTNDALAEGARRLRNTGLFDAVNIAMPDLDRDQRGRGQRGRRGRPSATTTARSSTSRPATRASTARSSGRSRRSGTSFGGGISLDVSGTIGLDHVRYLEDGTVQLRQLGLESDAPDPGVAVLPGAPRLAAVPDRAHGVPPAPGHAAVRPAHDRRRDAGADRTPSRACGPRPTPPARSPRRPLRLPPAASATSTCCARSAPTTIDSQVPITTRTGSVGVSIEWEQRVDRSGSLSPLVARGRVPARGPGVDREPAARSARTRSSRSPAAASRFWPLGVQRRPARRLPLRPGRPARRRGAAARGRAVLRRRRLDGPRLRGRPARDRDHPGRRAAARQRDRRSASCPPAATSALLGSLDAQLRIWKVFADRRCSSTPGMITNQWSTVSEDDIRPSVGMALFRIVTPFGIGRPRARRCRSAPSSATTPAAAGTSSSRPAPSSRASGPAPRGCLAGCCTPGRGA